MRLSGARKWIVVPGMCAVACGNVSGDKPSDARPTGGMPMDAEQPRCNPTVRSVHQSL